MKIELISPSMGRKRNRRYVGSWSMHPLNMAVLAALTPAEHEVHFTDDRFDEIDYDARPDLVAITVETYTAKRAYAVAARFRARGVPVVLGGIQASLIPDEVIAHGDATLVGDAESAWPRILADAQAGTLRPVYREPRASGTLAHVTPRREIFAGKPYLRLELVEAGRGCPFTCDFCAIYGSYDQTYRYKAVDDIVADVKRVPGKLVYFVDDNFVSRPKFTKELALRLEPLGKRWFSHGSITMTNDEELLRLLQRSGCSNILIGFESLNDETLSAMGKSWNTYRRDYHEALAKLRDHGITVYGTFVFGYDTQTLDDVKRTLEFAIDECMALAAFNHLVPFPGTPLYARLREQGRLLHDKWWLADDFHFGDVAFRPKHMTPDELRDACFEARKDFYGARSIVRRALDFQANLGSPFQALVYFAVNSISGKGVRERQGWPVGREVDG